MLDKHIINPIDLLDTINDVLYIDLLEYAIRLNSKDLEPLIDPPQGLYIKGNSHPILEIGNKYYLKSLYLQDKGLVNVDKNIFSIKEDVVNEEGVIILKRELIRDRSSYLTFKPELPIIAMQVAKTLVLNYLNSLCPYTRVTNKGYLPNLIKETYIHNPNEGYETIEDKYEDLFEDLLVKVYNFVNKDIWFIYFHKFYGNLLIIEKIIDYRIYKYHESIYEANKQETEFY